MKHLLFLLLFTVSARAAVPPEFQFVNNTTVPVMVYFAGDAGTVVVPPQGGVSRATYYVIGATSITFTAVATVAPYGVVALTETASGFGAPTLDNLDFVHIINGNSTSLGAFRFAAVQSGESKNWSQFMEYFMYGFGFISLIHSAGLARRLLLKLRQWGSGGDV